MCKKIIALLLSLLLLCLTAAAFASEAVLTLRDVTPEGNYKIKLTRKIMLAPPNELATRNYHVQQGATTDGEFAGLDGCRYRIRPGSVPRQLHGLQSRPQAAGGGA